MITTERKAELRWPTGKYEYRTPRYPLKVILMLKRVYCSSELALIFYLVPGVVGRDVFRNTWH